MASVRRKHPSYGLARRTIGTLKDSRRMFFTNNMDDDLLIPQYDRRKSFYKKAKVRVENGKTILQSYTTDVVEIENGKPFVKGMYSQTTGRHIKEFLKQKGFRAESSKQIMQDYGKKQELKNKIQNKISGNDNSFLKSVGMVAMMGDVIGGKSLKEKNAWKTRMLGAGLSNMGLMIPDDWNSVKEKEKKKRLDKALKELMK